MNSVLTLVKIDSVLNFVKLNLEFLWLFIDGSVLEGQFFSFNAFSVI